MTLDDLFRLSPELSMAGLGVLVLLVDLVVRRKGLLPVVAVAGLAAPLAFSIALWLDLNGSGVSSASYVFGTLAVDKFALFFKFLFVGVAALVVLVSTEYVKKFGRFQAEYYALILLSTSG